VIKLTSKPKAILNDGLIAFYEIFTGESLNFNQLKVKLDAKFDMSVR